MLREKTSATPVVDATERRIPPLTSHPAAFETPAGEMYPENQLASQSRGIKDN